MPLRTPIDFTPRMTARRDAREVGKILVLTGLDPKAELGLELATMLGQRIVECRDLFSLRGVRVRRPTVILMAARSLAKDETQWARLESLGFKRTPQLLAAIAQLTERVLAPEARLPQPKPVARPEPREPVPAVDPSTMVGALRSLHRRGVRRHAVTSSPARATRPSASMERLAA